MSAADPTPSAAEVIFHALPPIPGQAPYKGNLSHHLVAALAKAGHLAPDGQPSYAEMKAQRDGLATALERADTRDRRHCQLLGLIADPGCQRGGGSRCCDGGGDRIDWCPPCQAHSVFAELDSDEARTWA